MSLKKAYCTHCHSKNEFSHIFEVNSEATVCYCPRCMKEYSPKVAIQSYNDFIQKLIEKTYFLLFERTEFYEAYLMFANILDIDSTIVEARFGRTLSLIYLSNLRRARFKDAITLIKEEAPIYYRKARKIDQYVKFLRRANRALEEYKTNYRKKLSVRTYYYDEDCIKLMFYNLKEICQFKAFLYDEVILIKEKYKLTDVDDLVVELEHDVRKSKFELNEKVLAVNGFTYSLSSFSPLGGVLLSHNENPEPIRLRNYRKHSLTHKDKSTLVISNGVYPDNSRIYHFIKKAIPWECLCALISIIFIYLIIRIPNLEFKIVFYVIGGIFLSLAAFLFIFSMAGRYQLKKRSHLIN